MAFLREKFKTKNLEEANELILRFMKDWGFPYEARGSYAKNEEDGTYEVELVRWDSCN